MSVDLSIVVLHFNRWDLTKDCLASIDAQEIPCTYEKVLVDNGSDSSIPFSEEALFADGWRLVRYKENRGHIVGQNRCFESAQGEWVLFVANDVRLYDTECIRELYNYATYQLFVQKRQVGQVQPMVLKPDKSIDHYGMSWTWPGYGTGNRWWNSKDSRIEIVPSTCYLMRKSVWKEVGGFDEGLSTSYEDVDIGIRLQQIGYTNLLWTEAEATHLGNATLRHSPTHTRAAFHRDRCYVVKKHYRGFDRWLRLAAIHLIDALPR